MQARRHRRRRLERGCACSPRRKLRTTAVRGFARRRLDVAGVVNCTGGDLDLTRAREPLVAQLLKEGVARPHANGLGLDVHTDGRVIAADGAVQANLYTLGALTQGAFWESTAVPEIRVQAAAIAELLATHRGWPWGGAFVAARGDRVCLGWDE